MAGRFTPRKRDLFLKCLREGFSVRSACKRAGVSHTHVYRLKGQDESMFDEQFAEAWEDAIAEGTAMYEDELKERIMEGEPVLGREGEIVGYRKSDRLLEFALKARDPDTYAEKRKTELTGADGGPLQTEHSGALVLDDRARKERIRDLREALGKRDEKQ